MSTFWDFTVDGASVLKTLRDYDPPREQSFDALSLRMVDKLIYLYEAGVYATAVAFEQMGTIDGDIATDLQDAYDKIEAIIPSGGSVTPSSLISSDADNALVLGGDNKLFVSMSGAIPVTSDIMAENGKTYTANTETTIIFTDPTPEDGKGYVVYVIGGSSTIGGVDYVSADLVYRFYDGLNSSWFSINISPKLQNVLNNQNISVNKPISLQGSTVEDSYYDVYDQETGDEAILKANDLKFSKGGNQLIGTKPINEINPIKILAPSYNNNYTYNDGGRTETIPLLSIWIKCSISVINMNAIDSVTITSNDGVTNDIFSGGVPVNSITILAGQVIKLFNNGISAVVM